MAKMKLSESTFSIIPEGTTIFKVMEVDDSKYDDFGKLAIKMQTAKGETHTENFTLIRANGEVNDGALRAWSYFARVCLNNFQVDEIDTQDPVGCYIQATVKHEKYIRKSGERAGTEGTAVRLNDYAPASGFAKAIAESKDVASEDLDDFLNS